MRLTLLSCLLGLSFAALADQPLVIPVAVLGSAPKVDGDLGEWGSAAWIKVPITAALPKADRAKYGLEPNDDRNQTGDQTVQMKAGVAGDRLFIAFKYPDSSADSTPKLWEWQGSKYVEGKQREDMMALRFHMSGDFDRSMLTTKDYRVDVWLWSAARTNSTGVAEDLMHHITGKMLESAAEYESPDKKTIYIKKTRDTGEAAYKLLPRPRKKEADTLPTFEFSPSSGSAADVAAKGQWKAGNWQLEFSRAMSTGNADDVVFKPGQKVLGQIAIFNQGYAEHKSVSEPLMFDFSAVK